jgi:hypothetical protein
VQPSRLAIDLVQIQDPKVPGTPVRMVGLHATEAAEATLLPFFARAVGVSPPWFGEPNICAARIEHCPAASEHKIRSGGRQPAVVPIRACNGDRFLRSDYVSHRTFASRTTAGSRQPLLAACASVVADMRFSPASMPVFPTAGSRQPLLVHDIRSPHKAPFAMHKRTFARAAGVSPPWLGNALAMAFC